MVEAIDRLRSLGYDGDVLAAPGGYVQCGTCGELILATQVVIDEIVRFEGDSNPDDEAILAALTMPSGHHGLYVSGYGADVSADDADVLVGLTGRPR